MGSASCSPEEIAAALQRFYSFTAERAIALATASLAQIRSPWAIPGMAALVERLIRALQRREPLLLFGDFDTDGVTGSVVLFHTLAAHSDHIYRYNPFYQEGYGLHVAQVERFAGQGMRMILTVDSGISSYEAVERAGQLGLEVLITDHHLPPQDPGRPATLWINPSDYLLSGAQLAYMVAWALRQRLEGAAGHDPWGLAMSAIGAQMDWVPVDEPETRAWVAAGHALINSVDCPAELQALRNMVGREYVPSEMLSVGGLLNMAKRSRLVDPNTIVEVLLPEATEARRQEVYQQLSQESARARRATEAITSQAMADVQPEIGQNGLLIYEVHVPDDTLTEVEGPLTSRIVRVTGRPVLVLRPAGEWLNFSGRGRGSFSFESFLNDPDIRALAEAMGGHRQAIGGSLRPENRPAFLAAVRRWADRLPSSSFATSPRRAPEPLELLDPATAYLLGRAMGPFGHHLRPLCFQTTLRVRGGWAFSQDFLVETDRPLWEGDWQVNFRFDEAGCDGQKVALRLEEVQRETQRPKPAESQPLEG